MALPQKQSVLKIVGITLVVLGLLALLFILGVGAAVSKEAVAAGAKLPEEFAPLAVFFTQGAAQLPLAVHVSIAVVAIVLVVVIFAFLHLVSKKIQEYQENAKLGAIMEEGYDADPDYSTNRPQANLIGQPTGKPVVIFDDYRGAQGANSVHTNADQTSQIVVGLPPDDQCSFLENPVPTVTTEPTFNNQ